jgi:2'-hydroxyisoflavone reductase
LSLTVLVLGGTRFLGRAIVDAALAAGDSVTLFHRGITNPGLYPEADTVLGDRDVDLSALGGRSWDVVVDVAAYQPESVHRSADALAGRVGRYVLISTLSVYADHSTTQGQREDAPVLSLAGGLDPGALYGARKAACERFVAEVYGDRALIPRPGMIVGPHDPTDRFAYWPRRIARGGRVLAPGAPADPVQFVDARDLAGWVVSAYHRGVSGTFNLTGVPTTMGHLLAACGSADLVWTPTSWLLAAGVDPWMGVPMWIAAPGWEAANAVDVGKALEAGLTLRPLAETIRDVRAADRGPAADMFPAAEEQRLLAAYLPS